MTKTGANTVTLTTANTYKGGTAVTSGTLLVDNTSGSGTGTGAVTINSGGTLGGSGTISGATTLNGGGDLFPSASTPGAAEDDPAREFFTLEPTEASSSGLCNCPIPWTTPWS